MDEYFMVDKLEKRIRGHQITHTKQIFFWPLYITKLALLVSVIAYPILSLPLSIRPADKTAWWQYVRVRSVEPPFELRVRRLLGTKHHLRVQTEHNSELHCDVQLQQVYIEFQMQKQQQQLDP